MLPRQEKVAQEYHRPQPSLSLLTILCGPSAEGYKGHRGQGKKASQMPILCHAPSYVLDIHCLIYFSQLYKWQISSQLGKTKAPRIYKFAQDHTAGKWRNKNLNLGPSGNKFHLASYVFCADSVVVMVARLCEYTTNHWTVHFKCVKCIVCK